MLADPPRVKMRVRLLAALGLGDAHPGGLPGLRRLAGQCDGFLGVEGRAPVGRRARRVEVAQAALSMAVQHGVDHLEHLRGAPVGLVQALVVSVSADGAMEVLQEFTVPGTPFVERLLEVADDEDAAVCLRMFDDFVYVPLQYVELLGAGVLEFVQQPVLDAAIQPILDVLLLERVRMGQQGDVIAETQPSGPSVLLVVGRLVFAQASSQGPRLLDAHPHQLVHRPPDQAPHAVRSLGRHVDFHAVGDLSGLAFRSIQGGAEILGQAVRRGVVASLRLRGLGQDLAVLGEFVRRPELSQQECLHFGPFRRRVHGVGASRPLRLGGSPDELGIAPDRLIGGAHQQFMVFLSHLRQGLQRVGDFLAVIVILQAGQHRRCLRGIQFLDDALHRPQAHCLGLFLGHGGRGSAAQADLEREIVHQLREEAVQRAHGQPVRRQQGLPQHLPEAFRPELTRVQPEAFAQLIAFVLLLGGLTELGDHLHDEFCRGRPGEGQGRDLLVLHAQRQELHDAVGELECLAGAGRGQDRHVREGAHAFASFPRTAPRRLVSMKSSLFRPLKASRTG